MTDTPDISPNLRLPFYQTKQNEFEVQHNEALLMLDALAMLAVIDRDLSTPPPSPALGDRYLVKPTGAGDFAGNDNRIAQYDTGGWNFYAPQAGWTCYVQDERTLLAWNGAAWEPALDGLGAVDSVNGQTGTVVIPVREILAGDRTYYVRTDGDNANDGLSDAPGGAFATIQKAIDAVYALDLNGFDVTIQVGAGTYTEALVFDGSWVGRGVVTLSGDVTTPSNVIVQTATSSSVISVNNNAALSVQGLKLTSSGGGTLLNGNVSASITIVGNMEFSATTGTHINLGRASICTLSASYTISGGAARHYNISNNSVMAATAAITVTLLGTPAFTVAFMSALSGAFANNMNNITFSGGATGVRYSATLNAGVLVNGAGANFFPGDIAGSTTMGGQYA